ncbi:MAG: hypothetical protein RJQ09_07055 [Cyclobacteriaceae bacterium]
MKTLIAVAIAIIITGASVYLIVGGLNDEGSTSDQLLLSQWALSPDNHLRLAKNAYDRKSLNTSQREIEQAIFAMKSVVKVSDENTSAMLQKAVAHLDTLKATMERGESNSREFELASAHALNALALVNLRFSQNLSESGDIKQASKSVRTAITHLQNAVDLSSAASAKISEKVIINDLVILLDSLNKNGHLDEKTYTLSARDLLELIEKD